MGKFKAFILSTLLITGISATVVNNDRLYEISKNIEIFVNVYKELNANYVDDIDPNHLMKIGIDAMVGSLDPYTNYISEAEVESYRINTEGRYQGIGAVVKKVDDYATIIEPYQGSPVLEAGLKAGDQIVAVEGIPTKGRSTEEVTQLFRGVAGTFVNLTIRTPGEKDRKVSLERSEVSIPNVPYSGMVSDNVGYVSLTTFTPDATKNIEKSIKKLRRESDQLEGLILDLRNNGGGLLREAISISNLFIPKGKEIVSVKSKVRERDKSYKTLKEPLDLDIPVVVMINNRSASASEIVSGVLQDYDRAVIMGQRSYGKGLVQNTKDVGYNSKVKLTTSKYYIPSGRCIQSVDYLDGEPMDIPDELRSAFKTARGRKVLDGGGITPDVKLELRKDPEIIKALKEQFMIFKFVTEYVQKYPATDSIREIVFTEFEAFRQFLHKNDFNYQTMAEKTLSRLKEQGFEDDQASINNELEAIQRQIDKVKSTALDMHMERIIDEIETDIATRYHFQSGKTFQNLKNDEEILLAVDLVKDKARYSEILNLNR